MIPVICIELLYPDISSENKYSMGFTLKIFIIFGGFYEKILLLFIHGCNCL